MNDETRRKFLIRSIGSLGATIPIIYGCDSGGSRGGPLGPSRAGVFSPPITVLPQAVTLTRGSTQTFTATGGTAPYTWSVSNSNLGSIVVSTGVFTARTTTGTVTITATDTKGNSGTGTVTIASAIITVLPPSVTLTKGSSQTFTATGGTAPYTWAVGNSSLGSIVVSTGVFTAGATAGTMSILATDFNGVSGSGTITIVSPTILVTPSSTTIPNTVTVSFTQTFTASGGTSPYSYIVSGATNGYTGASLDPSTGILTISAIPTVSEGTQTLTITAADAFGATGTSTATVQPVDMAIIPSSLTIANTVTLPFTQTFTVSGGTAPYTYVLSGETNSYTGTTIAASTGVLTVTTLPTVGEGTQTLTITVTDANNNTNTATVTVNTA